MVKEIALGVLLAATIIYLAPALLAVALACALILPIGAFVLRHKTNIVITTKVLGAILVLVIIAIITKGVGVAVLAVLIPSIYIPVILYKQAYRYQKLNNLLTGQSPYESFYWIPLRLISQVFFMLVLISTSLLVAGILLGTFNSVIDLWK